MNPIDLRTPPQQPSDEATNEQLKLAREQGDAYHKAAEHMMHNEARGEGKRAGDYWVAYAVEHAEGMYHLHSGQLVWNDPEDENCPIEVVVTDGTDRRFIPGLNVHVTLIDAQGHEVGTHEHPFLWHPWLYHYGRNWKVPESGDYMLRVHIEPPLFMRHDHLNGKRYAEAVDVEFRGVKIETGQKKSAHGK